MTGEVFVEVARVRGGKGRHTHISRGRACGAKQSRVDQIDAGWVGTWHVIIAQIVAGWTILTLLVAAFVSQSRQDGPNTSCG